MNDGKEKLGVSGFLPPVAAALLVRSAEDAKSFAWDNSLRRAKIIEAAIRKVKLEYPRYFRAPYDCDCERQRESDRRGSRERSLFER